MPRGVEYRTVSCICINFWPCLSYYSKSVSSISENDQIIRASPYLQVWGKRMARQGWY